MINTYINEFIAVVSHVLKGDKFIAGRGFINIEKPVISSLLEKYHYATVEQKLRVWRELRWIETDPGRFTKRVRVEGKSTPVISINKRVYETLLELKNSIE